MRQEEVVLGLDYAVRVSGVIARVRILRAIEASYSTGRRRWIGRNLGTGREIVVTAARLRYQLKPEGGDTRTCSHFAHVVGCQSCKDHHNATMGAISSRPFQGFVVIPPCCPDCGAMHEVRGHQTCQYPQ